MLARKGRRPAPGTNGQSPGRWGDQADAGTDRAMAFLSSGTAGPVAKTYLTDSYLRRLGRLPLDDDDNRADFE
jgi:hypothetical protein